MIKYKFITKNTKYGSEYNLAIVEKPYEFLSQIFEGNETTVKVQPILEGIKKVKSKEFEDFSFENQSGFMAIAQQADPAYKEYPNAGVFIFDAFGPEDPLFRVSLDDMIKLLEDYKDFLEKNGR